MKSLLKTLLVMCAIALGTIQPQEQGKRIALAGAAGITAVVATGYLLHKAGCAQNENTKQYLGFACVVTMFFAPFMVSEIADINELKTLIALSSLGANFWGGHQVCKYLDSRLTKKLNL